MVADSKNLMRWNEFDKNEKVKSELFKIVLYIHYVENFSNNTTVKCFGKSSELDLI
jgi:hypothetical protein